MTIREDFEKWLDGEDFHGLCIDYRIASVEHTPDALRDLRAGILTAALESQAWKLTDEQIEEIRLALPLTIQPGPNLFREYAHRLSAAIEAKTRE
jgi:hypothetical protein